MLPTTPPPHRHRHRHRHRPLCHSYFSLSTPPTLSDECPDRDGLNAEWAAAMDALFPVGMATHKAGGHPGCVHDPHRMPKPGDALCKECKLMAEARLW